MKPLDLALKYASLGWSVFPITPGRKLPPLIPWKPLQEQRATDDDIRDWWRRWPNANIGIVTGPLSGLLVVDVDPRNGGDASLAKLEATHPDGKALITLEVGTATGGAHLYFRYPEVDGIEFRNTDGAKSPSLGIGVDTRAAGGMVLAPPSRRPEGAYSWCHGCGEVRDCPDWLLDLLVGIERHRAAEINVAPGREPTIGRAEQGDFDTRMNGLLTRIEEECGREGNRNALLHWAGCRLAEMLADGAPREYINLLITAGQAMRLPNREILATLRSAGVRS